MVKAILKNNLQKDINLILSNNTELIVFENEDNESLDNLYENAKVVLDELYNKKLIYKELMLQFIYENYEELIIDNYYKFYHIDNSDIVKSLIKINNNSPPQKSQEWYDYRYERITASDIGSIFGASPFTSRDQLINNKCVDPKSIVYTSNRFTEHGNKFEECATRFYEHLSKSEIIEFGCLPHPYIPFLGASPDGITKDGVMLEIKCPLSRPIEGIPPIYYWYQIQIQLEVANLNRCDFIECKFIEVDREILINNYKKCFEVGCIITLYDNKNKKIEYRYSPYGCKVSKIDKWINDLVDETLEDDRYDYMKTIFWQLKEYGLCSIYRDVRWFIDNIKTISDFWSEVLERRAGKIEITQSKKKRKIDNDSIYLLNDSDSDSN